MGKSDDPRVEGIRPTTLTAGNRPAFLKK